MTRRASTLLTGVLVFAALFGLPFAHVPVRYVALEPGPTTTRSASPAARN